MAYQPKISATLLLVAAALVAVVVVGVPAVGEESCPGLNLGGLISECGRYVEKSEPRKAPSRGCCGVVKKLKLECACKYVNKDVEEAVSVEKAVYVARYCGLPLPHGTKCGSYTIP